MDFVGNLEKLVSALEARVVRAENTLANVRAQLEGARKALADARNVKQK